MGIFTLEEIFSKNGLLEKNLHNFEVRPGQQRMAQEVGKILCSQNQEDTDSDETGKVLVIEAETGVGKTLAYLLPAVLADQKIVISTATITLQDQIIDKEIPLAEKILQTSIAVACVKGRENYLCRQRWFQYLASKQLNATLWRDDDLTHLEKWTETTETGDRAEIGYLTDSSPLWKKICSTSHTCLGSDCPESSLCFVNQLRKNAGYAKILVVNHHLFFSDLALRQQGYAEVLPRYSSVIFDEAHHIENIASVFFGISFSHYQVFDLLQDIAHYADEELDSKQKNKLMAISETVRSRSEDFLVHFARFRGRYQLSECICEIGQTTWDRLVDDLLASLKRLVASFAEISLAGEKGKLLGKRTEELHNTFTFATKDPEGLTDMSRVYWCEKREKTLVFSSTPLHVADLLRQHLYSSVNACILTSATLAINGDFSYLRTQLGLPDDALYHTFCSPFNYAHRTILYVPDKSFPEPTAPSYPQLLNQEIYEIIQRCHGRTLILCTSLKSMDSVADFLEPKLRYPLLVQGRAPRHLLLQQFRDLVDSVLLAVASFWEGVDIPGEALSCVIIDKLPFEVPSDPVLQAKIREVNNAGGKAFFDFQIPRAVLTLRQGGGRLMRTAQDKGVIAILDSRLFTKSYGKVFLKSLPDSRIVRDLAQIDEFWRQNPVP